MGRKSRGAGGSRKRLPEDAGSAEIAVDGLALLEGRSTVEEDWITAGVLSAAKGAAGKKTGGKGKVRPGVGCGSAAHVW